MSLSGRHSIKTQNFSFSFRASSQAAGTCFSKLWPWSPASARKDPTVVPPLCRGGRHQLQDTSAFLLGEKKLFLGSRVRLGKQSRDYFQTPKAERLWFSPAPSWWVKLLLKRYWSLCGVSVTIFVWSVCDLSAENTFLIDLQKWKK